MKLYLKFLSIHFRSAMTYRASFFLSCLGHLLITTNVFLSVVFLLDRFDAIGGYTLPQLSLCYSVILAATSLAECFGRGFDAFTRILAQAQFDRIMVRPRPLFFQVLCQDMKPTMLARVLQAAVMLVWAVPSGAVAWTPWKALTLALMILCGSGLFFGLALVNAGICFFTLEHVEALNIFVDGPREYLRQAGADGPHLPGAPGPGPALAFAVPLRPGTGVVRAAAHSVAPVFDPLLSALEAGGAALLFNRILRRVL